MKVLGLITLVIYASNLAWSQERAPNVVVLFADDAGYADFGFQPSCREEMKALTPHIDSIAAQGVRLTNAYMAGAVCSPSRAGLMTGRYPQRFGYDNNLPPGTKSGLDLAEVFGAKRLQGLGYHTGLVGKWHLGYPAEFHPNKRGFDWFYGLLQGSRKYFPIDKPPPHRVILENTTPTKEVGYITDRFGDAACRYIDEHVAERKDQPFFLFVSFTAPHSPLQPKKADAERIAHIDGKKRRGNAGLIVSLDDNIGKVLACLQANGLAENTWVIFTNDNGGQTSTGAKNDPLRGRKGDLYEGGIRVPWAMRFPSKIAAGSVWADPIVSLDIVPSLVELAGGKVQAGWELDGLSFAQRLRGKVQAQSERPLFWRKGGSRGDRAVRLGKWKLVERRSEPAKPELFDLDVDVGETTDLSATEPKVVAKLLELLIQWELEMKEPLWGSGAVR